MDRRSFIQLTAGAAVGAAARPMVAARPQRTGAIGANDRVRMAVVGAGNRAN
jgi:hypothetical protein